MPLFQISVLKKYISDINQTQLQNVWRLSQQHFFNTAIQQNIRNAKEEEYQEGFVRDLFVNVLGYTLNPQPDYNFVLEKKTITDATKSDGAILLNGEVMGVVELKDTGTPDLDKVSNQAFGYKHKHKNCIYIITSNFEKLRFYINDATDFEEFDLFTLSQERFALLFLCLQQQNIAANIPLQIKQQSLVQEENVTKKLYADYSLFKRKLFQNIAAQNVQHDKLVLFKKTQKLLDRFLFIFFAEDKSLLPPNSVREILKQWEQLKEMDNYVPLYERFKKYFGYLDVGHIGKQHEIFAYNGGLFLPDEILDTINIDDTILYDGTRTLSSYDFQTDIDVNILGHIFEHSLTEIEEIEHSISSSTEQFSSPPLRGGRVGLKRKKEGVFYTPRYITKYIVENTIGALCTQKKDELQINEEAFAPQKRKANRKALLTTIETYRNWLLQLTICDPACGSGAFLNAALEYLKAEHRTADELKARIFGDPIVYTDSDNSILENNLFGVDINEDAIEIAKLSLWLHTAKKGRKLSNLSNNIKCGNSLIDDATVAGDKAFKWKEEFKNVFKQKEKKAFHITTATHDSRTSERMVKYKVREKRNNGTRPKAEAVWLANDEEVLVTTVVAEIVIEDELNVMAYNICRDHMHLLLVCEQDEVSRIMQKIKSKTARAVNIHRGVTVPQQTREHVSLSAPLPTQHSLWTQKFGCKEITNEDQLWNTVEYIKTNREKHELPPLELAKVPIKQQGSMLPCLYQDYEHAFRIEYKGGFDVVIGNPPYGAKLDNSAKSFLLHNYKSFASNQDIFSAFYEQSIFVLSIKGKIGLITPVSWQTGEKYFQLRKLFKERCQIDIAIKLPYDVFADAYVDTGLYFLSKKKNSNYSSLVYEFPIRFKLNDLTNQTTFKVLQNKDWEEKQDLKFITSTSFCGIITKVKEGSICLSEISKSIRGILANKEDISDEEITGYKKLFSGDIYRYEMNSSFKWVKFGSNLKEKPNDYSWFQSNRILIRRLINRKFRIMAFYTDEEFVNKKDLYILKLNSENINIKYVLSLINCNLFSFLKTKGSTTASKDDFSQLTLNDVRELPIKQISSEQQKPFIAKADTMLSKNKELNKLSGQFTKLLQAKFATINSNNKLQSWYSLTANDFFKELSKQKIKLPLSEQQEWLQYFEQQKINANNIQQTIQQTDKEIDAMVYELYGLSEEEIKIIENG
jgi:type I restriction-modification system DNA methylase subunit/REP element-mobilizing transposase RayT